MSPNTNTTQFPEEVFTLMKLREDLEKTPWWMFGEIIHLKSEISYLEKITFNKGIEMALNDLVSCGILEEIKD